MIQLTFLLLLCFVGVLSTPYQVNLELARNLRASNPEANFGDTPFMSLTVDEFRKHVHVQRNLQRIAKDGIRKLQGNPKFDLQYVPIHSAAADDVSDLPLLVDWRGKGAVTPVKDQGQCGSCWSFSTTGSIEGQWFLAGNALTSLSEQELVSCDDLLSFGCNGGFSLMAYDWLIQKRNGTIMSDASYPYVSANGTAPPCSLHHSSSMKRRTTLASGGAVIDGGKLLLPWDWKSMMRFVANEGPLSVAMDATTLQVYNGGILRTCEAILPDHQVLVVGYDTSNASLPYWIVKNSWSKSWGEAGYFRAEMGKNLCLLEMLPNSATVLKP